ncbi:CsbD family protein [Kribbella sp. CA-253562]|uniref:CsbD family protein n=1 Tax=Kribbella sp. CA-253562 TaxID=3239942 RepID=UPI003D939D62
MVKPTTPVIPPGVRYVAERHRGGPLIRIPVKATEVRMSSRAAGHRHVQITLGNLSKEKPMGVGKKAKHAAKEAKGKVKEKTGDATDNRDLQAEGQAEKSGNAVKQAGEKVKDAFRK